MSPYLQNNAFGQLWKIKMMIYHRREYSLFKAMSGRGFPILPYTSVQLEIID